MNRTKIEYLDYTWNPLVGCSGVACAVKQTCWARKIEKRQKKRCLACWEFSPHSHLERLNQPLAVKKPSRIGLCFCADFFDKAFLYSLEHELIMDIVKKASWHTFILFTKQPQNIPLKFPFPQNVWLAVSVNRACDLWRIETLRQVDIKVKAVSFEPLLEPIEPNLEGINWLIIGAQTRPNFQPKEQWVKSLLENADRLGIPTFLKPNLKEWQWFFCRNYPEVRTKP